MACWFRNEFRIERAWVIKVIKGLLLYESEETVKQNGLFLFIKGIVML